MNDVIYAVPFFFLLMALEPLLDHWRGVGTYCLADAISSLIVESWTPRALPRRVTRSGASRLSWVR